MVENDKEPKNDNANGDGADAGNGAGAGTDINKEGGATPDPRDVELEKTRKENQELKFGNELTNIAATYPHATDFRDKIKEKVDAGMSVADATIVVLAGNGKLVTAEQIKRQGGGTRGMGGSMDNITPQDKKDPAPGDPGSVDFYANKFKDLDNLVWRNLG